MAVPRRKKRVRSARSDRRWQASPSIADLKAGSDRAWNEAVRILGPPIRGFISVRGVDDPDGTLGDVFLDLARGIDRFDGDWAMFRTLAFVIARRRVVDAHRAAARQPVDPIDGRLMEDLAVGGDVEHEAMDRLGREWALGLLTVLTPLQRDILTMRLISGLTIREVADITGATETGVKANQRRAVAALRRHLSRIHVSRTPTDPSLDPITTALGSRS